MHRLPALLCGTTAQASSIRMVNVRAIASRDSNNVSVLHRGGAGSGSLLAAGAAGGATARQRTA